MIRDDRQGGGGGGFGESAIFSDLNLFGGGRNVDNEMLVFQSRSLVEKVVRRLSLDKSYKINDGLRKIELYTKSPVEVNFETAADGQYFSFEVMPLDSTQVELKDFVLAAAGSQILDDTKIVATLGDTINTPVGRLVVTPTLYYADVYYDEPIYFSKSTMEGAVNSYVGKLTVALANKYATIINLTFKDESIPRAADALNTQIAVYNEDAINDKNQIAVNTSNFINDRLIIIEKELGSVDSNIESFKRENQLTDIKSETGMYLQNTSRFKQEGLSLDNQLSLAIFIRQYLLDPTKASDLIPANTGLSDGGIEQMIGEYNEILLRRDKLLQGSSHRNPVVMDLNNSLNAMRQSIIRSVDNLITGLNININNLREQENMTARRIEAVPSQQKYVLTVERQQKIKEELYLYLLNKREENELTQAITESNARIIDAAGGSSNPIAPKGMMILLAAGVIGVLIPAGILFIMNLLDTKVQNRKELENVLTIPILGDIPRMVAKNADKDEVVVRANGRDSVSEAFRIIRTNMDFMQSKSGKVQVIMFTSSNPGAGKTFVSSNLAMSIAQTDKKVVIVDVDIRKGTLSGIFAGASGKMGLTNYLSGRTDNIDDLIGKTPENKDLDIILAGPVPPNPAELLLSKRFDDLIMELRKRYDYIIVDNVPANVVADAAIVNRVADLTIYVVRAGMMDRRQLPELENLYRQGKFNNLSVVLNSVSIKRSRYG